MENSLVLRSQNTEAVRLGNGMYLERNMGIKYEKK